MNRMQIYEPAMCCSTGLCGVGVDPELLRISTVLNTLSKKGIVVERYNLSNAPRKFVSNRVINRLMHEKGVSHLPATMLDGEVVLTGRYPSNEEIIQMLGLSADIFGDSIESSAVVSQECGSEDDCCSDSNCCCEGEASAESDCCSDRDCCSDSDCCSGNEGSSETNCCSGGGCC